MNASVQSRLIMIAAVLVIAPAVFAQDYAVDIHTIDGGGGTAAGGPFELSGTIGQPDAGTLAGGPFKLAGGLWFGIPPGDCDGDGDVDLTDFKDFEACFDGPAQAAGGGCTCCDLDHDGKIALNDFSAFAAEYTGP